ncbi:AraC family transcriptional regulator [Rhodococcus sp. NPDC003318]|uniref:AraC family transcriptional regulator n=1 Tax=Rhodococcus sp. NPDC003318 TaxID=3364503 RepID=UPI00368239E9
MPQEDWEEASRRVADAYFPLALTNLSGGGTCDLNMVAKDLGGVTLGRVSWGADVAIESDCPGAYEIDIPLTGRLESRGHDGTGVTLPGQAALYRADSPCMITHWNATVLGVKLDRELLHREADRILGGPLRPALVLPDQLDFAGRAGPWRGLVHALYEQISVPDGVVANPVVAQQLAGSVVTAFVLAVAPDDRMAPAPRPGVVRRVLDALNDDPARPWTAADMAEVAGTSVRRMQETFAQHVGAAPFACLLDIRLDRARRDLTSGAVTVADVAFRWGFGHPGRFAAAFRSRYGVTPAELVRS